MIFTTLISHQQNNVLMAKQIFFIFLLGTSMMTSSIAQRNAVSYTNVEQVSDNASSKILFERAKDWYEEKALEGDMELLVNSKGQLIGEMYFDYKAKAVTGSAMVKGKIKCTVIVSVKDGRYKYLMKNFEHIPNGPLRKKYSFGVLTSQSYCPEDVKVPLTKEAWRDDVWRDLKLNAKKDAKRLAQDLKSAMNTNSNTSEDLLGNDW